MDTKEMSVEEAIEVIYILQRMLGRVRELPNKEYDETLKETNEVISLLQSLSTAQVEGEKYKTMWKELKQENGTEYTYFDNDLIRPKTRNLIEVMEELEQKYFPQPVKRVIQIEVEAKDEIAVNWFIGWLHDTVGGSNEFNHNTIKVNIKEDLNAN